MEKIKSKILSPKEVHERRRRKCLETFKKFKRFLKDTGQYHNVMTYLFPPVLETFKISFLATILDVGAVVADFILCDSVIEVVENVLSSGVGDVV